MLGPVEKKKCVALGVWHRLLDKHGHFFFIWFFFIFTVKHMHTGGQPPFCSRPLCKHRFLYIIRSSSRSPSDLANFQSQVWLAVFFFSLSLNRFPAARLLVRASTFPPATLHRWPEGGEGRWQGSLHHKTPAGHRPQQLPRGITASLSASGWTGPVCHIADTRRWEGGGGNQKVKKREGGIMGSREEGTGSEICFKKRKCMMGTRLSPTGLYRRHSHMEILDICISLTQIIFARTWKKLQKVKGHASVVDVSLVIATSEPSPVPQRPDISAVMRLHRIPHTARFLYEKRKKIHMTPFDGSEEDEGAPVLLLTRLSLLSTFVAPRGAATS